jgi:hypothetical protein
MKKVLIAVVALASLAYGQGTTGTILGRVADPGGAVIAGAEVTAVNIDTNDLRKSTTLTDGSYSLQFLPVGPYRVSIAATGFRHGERSR